MTPDRYDIACKAAAGSSKAGTRIKLQNLLANRFKLETHREMKELATCDLTVARGGSKLQRLDRRPSEADRSFRAGNGTLMMQAVTKDDLALPLSGIGRRQITDRTRIPGRYAFQLEYSPDDDKPDSIASDRPPLLVALREQLGLKLESTNSPVEVGVIDRVEKPPRISGASRSSSKPLLAHAGGSDMTAPCISEREREGFPGGQERRPQKTILSTTIRRG